MTRRRKKGYPQVKWVTCISCFHEYEKEEEYSEEGCPVCESKEYEESSQDDYGYQRWDGYL